MEKRIIQKKIKTNTHEKGTYQNNHFFYDYYYYKPIRMGYSLITKTQTHE